jgi:hypothetical protein
MIEAVSVSLGVAFSGWIASTMWRNRGHVALLLCSLRFGRRVRVSVAALLRVEHDGIYVLVHSPLRPNVYGPFGGAAKYRPAARPRLDALRFQEERRVDERMEHDLRGFLPFSALTAFARWLATGENHESATECLRRELVEELAEVGHPDLSTNVHEIHFNRVRKVVDGPRKVSGRDYHQIRFLEVWDLDLTNPAAVFLRDALLRVGHDADDSGIICAEAPDISHGRRDAHYVAPQSAFLIGDRRLQADLPAPS